MPGGEDEARRVSETFGCSRLPKEHRWHEAGGRQAQQTWAYQMWVAPDCRVQRASAKKAAGTVDTCSQRDASEPVWLSVSHIRASLRKVGTG